MFTEVREHDFILPGNLSVTVFQSPGSPIYPGHRQQVRNIRSFFASAIGSGIVEHSQIKIHLQLACSRLARFCCIIVTYASKLIMTMKTDTKDLLVDISGLRHTYMDASTPKQVLHDISMSIKAGSNVFLTGYSGSGKTTLISLIGCLRSVQEGSLKLLGTELQGASENQLRDMRRRIGYVFQHFNLLDFMTVRQNVQISLELQPGFNKQEARERSEALLERVGLADHINVYPSSLSGGQKQRVAIARALVHQPSLVLADEPTAALDSRTGLEVMELFESVAREQNSAVLLVTHNRRLLENADEILHLDDGRLGTAVDEQLAISFPTLADAQIHKVSDAVSRRSYQPGEVIIRQGDKAEEFFVLLKGELSIIKEDPEGDTPIASLHNRGDYFGEIGLLQEDARRTATVRVSDQTPAEVLVMEKQAFADMVSDSNQTLAVLKDEMLRRLVNH